MSVRRATPDDAAAIERVRTDTWRATYRGHMPDAVLDGLGYDGSARRRSLAEMPADRFALVAEHEGEVVGFCFGGPSRVEDAAHPGEIYAIYVLPAHQGHGHGAALLGAGFAECHARGWRGVLVWVLRENGPARAFYERMGGRHLAQRDEERDIAGALVTEAAYAWDDVRAIASPAAPPGSGPTPR